MKHLFFVLSLSIAFNAMGQNNISITPAPAHININEGLFVINKKTIISSDEGLSNAKDFLTNYLKTFYKFVFINNEIATPKNNTKNSIELILDREEKNNTKYYLEINKDHIKIKGSASGVFYGVQSLIQLLPLNQKSLSIRNLVIEDSARFNYRGMHLDAARHFFSVIYIKKYIDYLALHKFNTLHWHLTDDQGWRIEIKKYPLLTEKGSCRNQTLIGPYGTNKYDGKKYCGFYTQEEIKEIVKYASDRYINIIPEIEMPGHSMAALASYPFLGCTKGPYEVMQTWGVSNDVLCAGNDSTFIFLQHVIDEVIQLFPSPYIHIGGDECPKDNWHNCNLCVKRMKDNNLKDEHELQSYFINKIEKYINSKGRNIIGWDEILEGGLAPNATVMSWRGEEGGITAARQHHFAIMTPGNPLYFDHTQSINEDSITQGGYNSLKLVYDYEPVPNSLTKEEAKYILGAQANMWTEYMDNERKLEYMLFPRMAALSEVLWTSASKKNWNRFENNIPDLFERYKLWNINFSRAIFDIQTSVGTNNFKGISWQLTSNNKKGKLFYKCTDSTNATDLIYEHPIEVNQSGTCYAVLKDDKNTPLGPWVKQTFYINKATGRKIALANPPSKSYNIGGELTLVDGIQNNIGMSKSAQFLGFSGTDLNALIDLGEVVSIDSIKLHAFEQRASWIYRPSRVSFFESKDGINYDYIFSSSEAEGTSNLTYKYSKKSEARYLKIIAQNMGTIPSGASGSGNKSWLFADEIEVF